MRLNLIDNILQFTANREPRTANREQSSLNFFNSFKDKLLFIRICLVLLLQKFNINLVKYFLIAFICFAKISSLIKNSLSFAEGVLWERGDSRSNLFCVDCFVWQHARFSALAMTILIMHFLVH